MVRDNVIPAPQVAFLWRLTDENITEPIAGPRILRMGLRLSGESGIRERQKRS